MSGYSPILELGDDPLTPRESLTRPVVGIENRTAQEVFDIMSDRFRAHLTALASGSGDHAELARLAEEALVAKTEDRNGYVNWRGVETRTRFENAANPATVLALLAENAALREDRDQWRIWYRKASVEINAQDDRATEAERKLAEAAGLNERAADLMRQCTDPERFEGASTLNVYANMRACLSDLPPAPGAEA